MLVAGGVPGHVDRIGTDTGYLAPADLDALDQLDELTAEQEFEQALDTEGAGGTWGATALVRSEDDERQDRAWGTP